MLEPERRFYSDLRDEEKKRWLAECTSHPASAQLTPLTHAAWQYHPVSYLFCERDEAIVLEDQKAMVKGAGVPVDEHYCQGGHSPFLSMPEEVVRVVDAVAVQERLK